MRDIGLFLAAFLAAYVGFACLALAMVRHWREALGQDAGNSAPGKTAVVTLRVLGVAALGVSLWLSIYGNGPSFGGTLWSVLISLGALAVVATLTWRPAWLRPMAVIFRGQTAS